MNVYVVMWWGGISGAWGISRIFADEKAAGEYAAERSSDALGLRYEAVEYEVEDALPPAPKESDG